MGEEEAACGLVRGTLSHVGEGGRCDSMAILPRLILKEVILVALLAQAAVTGLLMLMGALLEGGKSGLDPLSVLSLTPYIVAPSLPYTIPACLLFGATYVFGTFAGTNELVAVKAGGVNPMRLFRPVFALAIVVSLGCVLMADRVIPWSQERLRATLLGDIETTLFTYLRQKSCITGPDFPYELYVRGIDGTRLVQPIIKHRRQGQLGYDMVLQAREASLEVLPSTAAAGDFEIVIRLVDGVLSTEPGNSAYFRDRTERMPLPTIFKAEKVAVADQTFQGLDEQSERFEGEVARGSYEASLALGVAALQGDMATVGRSIEPVGFKLNYTQSLAFRSRCEKHQRIARSTAAIPFVLLGAPLSILYRRREVLRKFFVCFLPIITIYYPTLILAYNVLKETRSEMWGLLWVPSILMSLAAIPFVARVIKY